MLDLFRFFAFAKVGMHVEISEQQNQTDAIGPEKPKHSVAEVTTMAQGKCCMNDNGHKLELLRNKQNIC